MTGHATEFPVCCEGMSRGLSAAGRAGLSVGLKRRATCYLFILRSSAEDFLGVPVPAMETGMLYCPWCGTLLSNIKSQPALDAVAEKCRGFLLST